MDTPQLAELAPTPQTPHYGEPFLQLVRGRFEREALWLLLSIHHYGWRAHLDIANRLVGDVTNIPEDDEQLHHWQHRMMAAGEEVFVLVEQLWRVAASARDHRAGKKFLATYCARREPKAALEELCKLEAAEWAQLLAVPTHEEIEAAREPLELDDQLVEHYTHLAHDLPAECMDLMQNIKAQFFDKPALDRESYALREANNAHRHGTRLLYGDTAPETIGWLSTVHTTFEKGPAGSDTLHPDAAADTIDVLIRGPGSNGAAYTLKLPYTVETATALLASMERLSQLVHQIVGALLISEAYGPPVLTALIAPEWEQLVGPEA